MLLTIQYCALPSAVPDLRSLLHPGSRAIVSPGQARPSLWNGQLLAGDEHGPKLEPCFEAVHPVVILQYSTPPQILGLVWKSERVQPLGTRSDEGV